MLREAINILSLFASVGSAVASSDSAPVKFDARQGNVRRYARLLHSDAISIRPAICSTCGVALSAMAAEVNNDAVPAANSADSSNGNTSSISSKRIPDVRVYDQNGKQINFYSQLIKDKTVVIDFIFTTCSTICPLLTATFSRVQQNLTNDAVHVQLISVSVDPVTDTPKRLHDFAAKFKVAPGWVFVTGNKNDIDSLLLALEAGVGDKNEHTARIVIGNDAADYWTTTSGSTSPAALVHAITDAANRK